MSTITHNRTAVDPSNIAESDLPEGWTYSTIDSLLTVNYGKGLKESLRRNGSVSVYGSNGVVGRHNKPLTSGPTIIIGRKGTVGAVHFSLQSCWPIDTTFFVEEFHKLNPLYLTYGLRTLNLSEHDTSTAIPGLSRGDLYSQKLALAPLAEQIRIVAKIEDLLEQVNASRDHLAKVPKILKRFRQSVLAAACSGRLTEDWRERNPDGGGAVKKLLSKILSERKAKTRNTKEPCEPDTSLLGDVPEEWIVVSTDALMSHITSGSRDWKRYYRDDGTGTFVMAKNVRPLRFDTSVRQGVQPPPNDRDRERSEVKKGDLLITIVGANTGDLCRVTKSVEQHYVCQSVALMRPVFEETSQFLEIYLNSAAHGLAQYQNWIYGEGRPHLSFEQLKATAVALPPLKEIQEIVRRVEALFKLADMIEQRVQSATNRANKLTQAILAKAFRGELVPTEAELARSEGRDYEPASILLARIKAERAKSSTTDSDGNRPRRIKSRKK